jgi:hypothetical protein
MRMHEIWTWILNFTGVNNGDNSFGTHMYNFWSGFGGNVSILALIGILIAIYKRTSKKLKKLEGIQNLNPLHLVHLHETEQSNNKTQSK